MDDKGFIEWLRGLGHSGVDTMAGFLYWLADRSLIIIVAFLVFILMVKISKNVGKKLNAKTAPRSNVGKQLKIDESFDKL